MINTYNEASALANDATNIINQAFDFNIPVVGDLLQNAELNLVQDIAAPFNTVLTAAGSWSQVATELPTDFSVLYPFTVDANGYGIPNVSGILLELSYSHTWNLSNILEEIDGSAFSGFSYLADGDLSGGVNASAQVTLSFTLGVSVNCAVAALFLRRSRQSADRFGDGRHGPWCFQRQFEHRRPGQCWGFGNG